jgi:hypothetical protein
MSQVIQFEGLAVGTCWVEHLVLHQVRVSLELVEFTIDQSFGEGQ